MALKYDGSGFRNWLLQRITALYLVLYSLYLSGYFFYIPVKNYEHWAAYWTSNVARGFAALALLAILVHAWLGVWTVMTDYIKPWWIQKPLQVGVLVALVANGYWGVKILWGF